MKKNILVIIALTSLSFSVSAMNEDSAVSKQTIVLAQADPHAGHSMDGGNVNKAKAKGTLHTIDVNSKTVNMTHDPIPELGWPKMTMDLSTTKRVKLNNFKQGDEVEFEIKKGRDNRFRITKMKTINK